MRRRNSPLIRSSAFVVREAFHCAFGKRRKVRDCCPLPRDIRSVAVDAEGNAVVSGYTGSPNFPTLNAVQPRRMGLTDGFVLKVNATGSALVYATYLGGGDSDQASSIAIDATGTAYVTGQTLSTDFPTVAARQPTFGGQSDAYVAAFNSSGSLLFSTYLGGSGWEFGAGIAVAGEGHLFVVGSTGSLDFPTKDALQPAHGGGQDVFVAKLSALDGSLVYSTFLGGSESDTATGIAVDLEGNSYVSGDTSSANFPTARPIQAALRGEHDIFVAKLDGSGSQLLYSTYLGGNGNIERASAIAIDGVGNAYVTGFVYEWLGFPLVHPLQDPAWIDGFVAKIADRPSCPEDVTASVDFLAFPFWRIPFTPFRFQWAIIHNKTAVPIAGPLALVMDDLRNAVFIGSRSATNCFSPEGNPFMVVQVGRDNVLSPNESSLTGLWFFKTQFGRITYAPRVLSGIPTQ